MDDTIAARLAYAKAVVFDMDGTLVLGNAASGEHRALPGAVELIELLRRRRTPFCVFTNGTAKSPAVYAASLRSAGIQVDDAQFMTPSTSAARWFTQRGIRRVRALGLDGLQEPLRSAGLDIVGPSETADHVEAVFTGWFREFTLPDLEAACSDIWSGAVATTASNVPFFAARGGRAIGTSFAINSMIHALTRKRAKVLGKPSRDALYCAMQLMGLPTSAARECVVIGDDPALEIRMAHAAGALAVAVTTGLEDRASLLRRDSAERPHVVVDGLGSLIEVLAK